jgi:hypothetical protein
MHRPEAGCGLWCQLYENKVRQGFAIEFIGF